MKECYSQNPAKYVEEHKNEFDGACDIRKSPPTQEGCEGAVDVHRQVLTPEELERGTEELKTIARVVRVGIEEYLVFCHLLPEERIDQKHLTEAIISTLDISRKELKKLNKKGGIKIKTDEEIWEVLEIPHGTFNPLLHTNVNPV